LNTSRQVEDLKMQLLELDPYEIHFGDHSLENNWQQWGGVDPSLMKHIAEFGILDPILVYKPVNNLQMLKRLYGSFGKDHDFSGYWCWRGTQRIRIARLYHLPTIPALWIHEDMGDVLDPREIQKHFNYPIQFFWNKALGRWDVRIDWNYSVKPK